jgi:hypothetical protein
VAPKQDKEVAKFINLQYNIGHSLPNYTEQQGKYSLALLPRNILYMLGGCGTLVAMEI